MSQLPQRNFVPFAVTMQCGDIAGAMTGAGAGAGAEAGAGDMAGVVAIAGDEAIAIAVAEGRGVYCCHAPRALCCMTAKIYVCIYIWYICVCPCLSLQQEGYGMCCSALLLSGEGVEKG